LIDGIKNCFCDLLLPSFANDDRDALVEFKVGIRHFDPLGVLLIKRSNVKGVGGVYFSSRRESEEENFSAGTQVASPPPGKKGGLLLRELLGRGIQTVLYDSLEKNFLKVLQFWRERSRQFDVLQMIF